MAKLLILGAGGHGKVVSEVASLTNKWDEIAFLDDRETLNEVQNIPVIGRLNDFEFFSSEYQHAFVAIGNNEIRMAWMERLKNAGYTLPVLTHPFSFTSKTSKVGEGTVIMAGTVINTSANIGKGCILNTNSSVDHDCVVEDGVHISPGVSIGGTTTIGKLTWIGIGSSIINNINVGSNVIVAAGSAVNKAIPDNVMVAGIPSTIKKQLGVNVNE